MRFYFLLLFCGLSLLSDLALGLRFFRSKKPQLRRPAGPPQSNQKQPPWRLTAFWGQLLLLDIALPAAAVVSSSSYWDNEGNVQLTLWLMWAVVAVFTTKVIFAAFVVFGAGVGAILRRRLRFFDYTGATLAAGVFFLLAWGAHSSRSRVRVNRIEITSDKIPAAFDGYRIAHFSDLHTGNLPKNHRLIAHLTDSIRRLQPDLIVQTGDLVNLKPSELTAPVLELLGRLRAPDGVAAVLGNHDLGFYNHDGSGPAGLEHLRAIQRDSLGWRLLVNDRFWVYRAAGGRTDSIAVAGIGYPADRVHRPLHRGYMSDLRRALHGVDQGGTFSILLSHAPMIWDSVPAVATPDLTLSGHIHSMQIKLRLGQWLFSPAQWGYRQWSGLYRRAGRWLYVNDGIGYVFIPMRLGTPAEITLYTLKSTPFLSYQTSSKRLIN